LINLLKVLIQILGLLSKILSGEKSIESRWYKNRYAPWDKIRSGDKVYFKNSGEPVTVIAEVEKVLQFEDLNQVKVGDLLEKYGKRDGIEKNQINHYYQMFKHKNYCVLIFLKNPKKLTKPFEISKKGYGAMSAWIVVEDINKLKI